MFTDIRKCLYEVFTKIKDVTACEGIMGKRVFNIDDAVTNSGDKEIKMSLAYRMCGKVICSGDCSTTSDSE